MYTIKINVKENVSPAGELLDTLYLEASNIKTKIHSREKGKSIDDLLTEIKKDKVGDFFFHNPSEESWNILHISYFNDKGEFKNMFVFSNAIVYIMQNGKTVDSIYV